MDSPKSFFALSLTLLLLNYTCNATSEIEKLQSLELMKVPSGNNHQSERQNIVTEKLFRDRSQNREHKALPIINGEIYDLKGSDSFDTGKRRIRNVRKRQFKGSNLTSHSRRSRTEEGAEGSSVQYVKAVKIPEHMRETFARKNQDEPTDQKVAESYETPSREPRNRRFMNNQWRRNYRATAGNNYRESSMRIFQSEFGRGVALDDIESFPRTYDTENSYQEHRLSDSYNGRRLRKPQRRQIVNSHKDKKYEAQEDTFIPSVEITTFRPRRKTTTARPTSKVRRKTKPFQPTPPHHERTSHKSSEYRKHSVTPAFNPNLLHAADSITYKSDELLIHESSQERRNSEKIAEAFAKIALLNSNQNAGPIERNNPQPKRDIPTSITYSAPHSIYNGNNKHQDYFYEGNPNSKFDIIPLKPIIISNEGHPVTMPEEFAPPTRSHVIKQNRRERIRFREPFEKTSMKEKDEYNPGIRYAEEIIFSEEKFHAEDKQPSLRDQRPYFREPRSEEKITIHYTKEPEIMKLSPKLRKTYSNEIASELSHQSNPKKKFPVSSQRQRSRQQTDEVKVPETNYFRIPPPLRPEVNEKAHEDVSSGVTENRSNAYFNDASNGPVPTPSAGMYTGPPMDNEPIFQDPRTHPEEFLYYNALEDEIRRSKFLTDSIRTVSSDSFGDIIKETLTKEKSSAHNKNSTPKPSSKKEIEESNEISRLLRTPRPRRKNQVKNLTSNRKPTNPTTRAEIGRIDPNYNFDGYETPMTKHSSAEFWKEYNVRDYVPSSPLTEPKPIPTIKSRQPISLTRRPAVAPESSEDIENSLEEEHNYNYFFNTGYKDDAKIRQPTTSFDQNHNWNPEQHVMSEDDVFSALEWQNERQKVIPREYVDPQDHREFIQSAYKKVRPQQQYFEQGAISDYSRIFQENMGNFNWFQPVDIPSNDDPHHHLRHSRPSKKPQFKSSYEYDPLVFTSMPHFAYSSRSGVPLESFSPTPDPLSFHRTVTEDDSERESRSQKNKKKPEFTPPVTFQDLAATPSLFQAFTTTEGDNDSKNFAPTQAALKMRPGSSGPVKANFPTYGYNIDPFFDGFPGFGFFDSKGEN